MSTWNLDQEKEAMKSNASQMLLVSVKLSQTSAVDFLFLGDEEIKGSFLPDGISPQSYWCSVLSAQIHQILPLFPTLKGSSEFLIRIVAAKWSLISMGFHSDLYLGHKIMWYKLDLNSKFFIGPRPRYENTMFFWSAYLKI